MMKRFFSVGWLRHGARFAVACLVASLTGTLHAGLVISGTRVVFPGNEREVTLRVRHEGAAPSLVQAWLDTGDVAAAPGSIDVPFVVLPPVFRLDPGRAQVLRILHSGSAMANDRESLFWLNVLEVPPRPQGAQADSNHFQLAYRTRIKLFYRPPGLPGRALGAWENMSWRLARDGSGQWTLVGDNPGAFHVNYGALVLRSGEASHSLSGTYAAPRERLVLPLPERVGQWRSVTLEYSAINDWGGNVEGKAPVAVGP